MSKTTLTPEAAAASLWLTQTFTWGPVRGQVHEATLGDEMRQLRIKAALPPPVDDAEELFIDFFARMATQTDWVEGLDLPFPDSGATPTEWQQAFQDALRMNKRLTDAWYAALRAVDAPEGPRDTWPTHYLSEAERKNRVRGGATGSTPNGSISATSTPTPTRD